MQFEYRGVKIYYETVGEGRPLLMVHGWGGSSKSLRQLAHLTTENGKRKTILVDLPGFGQSQNPPPSWGTGEYANTILALLDELNIDKIDYFGHSFGGSLGIYLAANTNRIHKLILCNSSYKRTCKQSKSVQLLRKIRKAAADRWQSIRGLPDTRAAAKRALPPEGDGPLDQAGKNALTESIRDKMIRNMRILFYTLFFRNSDLAKYPHLEPNFRRIVAEDLTPLLPRIKALTLILWGEQDTVTPISYAHELNTSIINSQLSIIPGATHGLPRRNPELLVEPIRTFLAS